MRRKQSKSGERRRKERGWEDNKEEAQCLPDEFYQIRMEGVRREADKVTA